MVASSSSPLLLLFLLGVCGAWAASASGFRICAFNLHSFGQTKASNTKIMHTLVRIITRCDITLLQEVRDNKIKAVPMLMAALNRYDSDHVYEELSSERLGRTSAYQEQYVFVYRTDSVTVRAQYQYPDDLPGKVDAFAREPFVVHFNAPKTAMKDFVLVPQHTSPDNATTEMDALYDVFLDIKSRWRTEKVMFLGDFNADCGYLAKKNRQFVRLITNTKFFWLIKDKTDTTVRESTSCAYDRIVVHGESFARAIVPLSAKPFNFQQVYHLTEEQALAVSDHYPVEVLLKSTGMKTGSSRQQEVFLSFLLLLLLLAFTITCD